MTRGQNYARPRLTRGPEWITYGLDAEADLQATDLLVQIPGGGYQTEIVQWGLPAGTLRLAVPGQHNVRNALAAIAAAVYAKYTCPDACHAFYLQGVGAPFPTAAAKYK